MRGTPSVYARGNVNARVKLLSRTATVSGDRVAGVSTNIRRAKGGRPGVAVAVYVRREPYGKLPGLAPFPRASKRAANRLCAFRSRASDRIIIPLGRGLTIRVRVSWARSSEKSAFFFFTSTSTLGIKRVCPAFNFKRKNNAFVLRAARLRSKASG